ncbi:MAG: DUF465 domain-containing protein [Deltaproteobacteria bacterium]|nr:DUF465 domain-containing protein [Deltaproteobacteria bacterium]
MDQQDLALISKVSKQDESLQRLWEEHQKYEHELDELNHREYLTPEETVERKRLQKCKLAGKDKIETILRQYR